MIDCVYFLNEKNGFCQNVLKCQKTGRDDCFLTRHRPKENKFTVYCMWFTCAICYQMKGLKDKP